MNAILHPFLHEAADIGPIVSRGTGADYPFITLAVPVLNEALYIERCLDSLIFQWPADVCEILVFDGGSTDATRDIVAAYCERHPQVRLVANPARLQSAALNMAAEIGDPRSDILVRADAHALYPPGFLRSCIADLQRTGATSVVVPMRNMAAQGRHVQRAIAAAQSSRLGNGGASHRHAPRSHFVDHGHHAVFDRAFFRAIGGYDTRFACNEDAEYDLRAAAAGGRAWMCADAPVGYFPRKSLMALSRQYFRHGRGRGQTVMKHRAMPRLRQLAPVGALAGSAGALLAAPVVPGVAAMALTYPLACLGWAALKAVRGRDPWLVVAAPALITMHLSWAAGFLNSLSHGAIARLAGVKPRAASRLNPGFQ